MSYAVMVIPIIVVVLVAGVRFNQQRLKYLGIALALSGACAAIGARFFGLYGMGRRSILQGDDAFWGATALTALAAILFGVHHLVEFFRSKKGDAIVGHKRDLDGTPTSHDRIVGVAGALLLCAAGAAGFWFSAVVKKSLVASLLTGAFTLASLFFLFRFVFTSGRKL